MSDSEPEDYSATDGSSLSPNLPHDSVLPFKNFVAPEPRATEPPTQARWLAFAGIIVGGLLGGMIGYGTADLLGAQPWLAALAAVAFAIGGASGVGIVAQLTLRAMNEWRAVQHPEDPRRRS
ncbi:MAG: hypothetical protein HKN03_12365 [Acidimicrobiales bacterium]|nr:hypothetical protein [Acidimicrobiales bacterium]